MMRVGLGSDAHRFADDERELVLGGVRVPGHVGLAGHSDADVVTHALCDAILGAAGLGDLGRQFPDDDPTTAGVSSLVLLRRCRDLARDEGFVIGNADVTVTAERPRLSRLLDEMSSTLGGVLAAPVSVKATTSEGMGAIGRGEGIAATAVVLLVDPASR
jgi:2-C-methyl-D-erythritol 2,4-cyclodiphosphate synthase